MQRPSRQCRRKEATAWDGLPYPDGEPDPSSTLQVLAKHLDTHNFTSIQLLTLDDTLIHALMDKKRRTTKNNPISNRKFTEKNLDNVQGSVIATLRNHFMPLDAPLEEWRKNAESVWEEVGKRCPELFPSEDRLPFIK